MRDIKAYSLVELVLAIGIFATVVSSVIFFSVEVFSTLGDFNNRVKADIARDAVFESIATIKRSSWQSIIENVNNSPMYVDKVNGGYAIEQGTYNLGEITYSFTITQVRRDAQGDIVSSGGEIDPHTMAVNLNFQWEDVLGRSKEYPTTFYVSDWNTYRWVLDTQSEFNTGSRVNTIVTNNSGGEVQLGSIIYSDWCKPQNTLTSFDLPGQGIANTLSATPSRAYIGTGNNASGLSFIRTDINHVQPPTATTHGTFDGYKVNDSYGEVGYAYLATDTNGKEVVILNTSQTPYVESGYFDSPGSTDANAIIVSGNYGYVGVGSQLYIFDITSKNGARSQVGSAISIGGLVTGLYISNNHLYVANVSTAQLKIVDITNPLSASIVGSATVNGDGASAIFAMDDRAYLATTQNVNKREVFIIDVSSNVGNRNVIASLDTNGMSPKGITKVASNRVIVVGTGGFEYQVLNTSNESAPILCGQLNIDSGVNDTVGITLPNGDTYSYIVTGDSSGELKIIKGGEGGGGEDGYGYSSSGTYTSEVLDTQSTYANYHYISWDRAIPANTNLRFQVRSSNNPTLSDATYIGPDGSSSTYYNASDSQFLHNSLDGKRYFQVIVYYTSDTISTPILNSFTLNYGK